MRRLPGLAVLGSVLALAVAGCGGNGTASVSATSHLTEGPNGQDFVLLKLQNHSGSTETLTGSFQHDNCTHRFSTWSRSLATGAQSGPSGVINLGTIAPHAKETLPLVTQHYSNDTGHIDLTAKGPSGSTQTGRVNYGVGCNN